MDPNSAAPSEASDVQMREQLRGVNQLHDGVDRMRADLKRLSKLAKAYVAASEPLNDMGLEFAEQLQDFGSGKDEAEIYVRQCGEMLKLTEAMRQLLVQQLESSFAEPLRVRLDAEAAKESSIKELHKQWTSTGEAYTDAHKKWNKAKDPRGSARPAPAKLGKIESEVADARTVFEKVTTDYNARLRDMEMLSKQELLDFLNNYMQANTSFFVSGYQLMKSMEPSINAMSASIAKAKGEPTKEEPAVDICSIKPQAASQAQPKGTNVTKQGYLFKKKSTGLKGWGIRWFVLDADGRLSWFKSWKKFTQQSESLNIFYSTVRPSDAGNLIFEIISKARPLQLKALNVQDFNDWLSTFSRAIQLNISIGSNIKPAERAELLAQQKRMDDEVRLMSPANTVCADCNAPSPDWASLNLGILLCIECSGVHRSLGSHISKIRSLTLDLWEPEQVEIMKHIGNAKANGFWEAELPREFLKPDERTVRRLREVWIDNKYKAKAFLPKDRIPAESLFQTMKDAACRLDLMTVERCVAYGAEVNAKNLGDNSKTVAHYLAEGGNQISLEFLFQNGADLTVKDAKGNLPIHYAAQRGHLDAFRLLLHRGSDAYLAEQNAEGNSVSDLAVLHPGLTEVLEKRKEKLKTMPPPAVKQLVMPDLKEKDRAEPKGSLVALAAPSSAALADKPAPSPRALDSPPSSGSKLKRASSAYSPRSAPMLGSSPPQAPSKLDVKPAAPEAAKAGAAGKNPTAPDPSAKPPVKPKPAHLSRRKLSDGAVQPSSRGGSQIYGTMPSIDADGPPPPEGATFSTTKDDASPRPPTGQSPRLSLRRSPPSAPSVTGTVSPSRDDRDKDKKDKKKDKDKDKDRTNVPISAPSNFRHVQHYESHDAPALLQQVENSKKKKEDGLPVPIGGPSGFRHVGSWQDQFEKKPAAAGSAPAVRVDSTDDVSSLSERKESLEKRALYPYPSMSVEVFEESSQTDSRRATMSNAAEAPASPPSPASPPELARSHSAYPPAPPGDSELSPRPEGTDAP